MRKPKPEPPPSIEKRFPSALQHLTALQTAMSDPHRLVDLLSAATDPEDAAQRIAAEYQFPIEEASVVLDNRFVLLVASHREELAAAIERERVASQDQESIGMVSEGVPLRGVRLLIQHVGQVLGLVYRDDDTRHRTRIRLPRPATPVISKESR